MSIDAAQAIEPVTPAAADVFADRVKFPVVLVEPGGQERFVGVILPMNGISRPDAVRVDGQIYVATGGFRELGADVPRAIYERTPACVFVATEEV